MSLLPCRACSHLVDTSALACPQCGATDPGHKLSRQQRDGWLFLAQAVVALAVAGTVGWFLWHELGPMLRALMLKGG